MTTNEQVNTALHEMHTYIEDEMAHNPDVPASVVARVRELGWQLGLAVRELPCLSPAPVEGRVA